jgi:hypothetical protein
VLVGNAFVSHRLCRLAGLGQHALRGVLSYRVRGVSRDELPELLVKDAATWRAWLAEHGASATEAWLVLAKKGAASPTRLRYQEALEEAPC